MKKIKAVVFDLDGTLVDSLADIAAAVNSTLVAHGREPHPLAAYTSMVGWGLRRLLVTASAGNPFPTDEIDAAYEQVLASYRARPVVHTRPYDGVVPLVVGLAPRVPIGVLSNKEDGMTKTIVASLFPDVVFQSVWGARAGVPHKPDPTALLDLLDQWGVAPPQCAFLGDSGVDMETARRAGAIACGACWGYRDKAELSAAGASVLFTDPEAFGVWLDDRLEHTNETRGGNP